jgi:hypothetical protein
VGLGSLSTKRAAYTGWVSAGQGPQNRPELYQLSRRSLQAHSLLVRVSAVCSLINRLSQAVWQRPENLHYSFKSTNGAISLGTLTSKENPALEDPDASRAKTLL